MVVLYPLSDFLDCNEKISHSTPDYWYEGRCPQSGNLLKLPRTPLAEAIAFGLMQQLTADNRYSVEGKMYGVILVELPDGEQRVLKAFSGLLNGCSAVEGWVPPIPGRDEVALEEARTLAALDAIKQELITLKQLAERQQYQTLSREFEQRLQDMSKQHSDRKQQRREKRQRLCQTLTGETLTTALEQLDAESRLDGIERRKLKRKRDTALQPLKQFIEKADIQMRELKQQRQELSRKLQAQMHAVYSLTNFSRQSLSLQALIPGGSIPTGTGDCCAPKLLHYAATHNLKPLAMAEFWWGLPSTKRDKVPGQFYGACTERCQPLMGFLLSGLSYVGNTASEELPLPPLVSQSVAFSIEENAPQCSTSNQATLSEGVWGTRPSPIGGFGGRPPKSGFPIMSKYLPSIKEPHPRPLPVHGEGCRRRSGVEWELPLIIRTQYHSQECNRSSPIFNPNNGTETDLTLPIIYEDQYLIVVNKPSGLLSVPGRYCDRQDSVLSRLRLLLPEGMQLNAVHRLDLETSGILLLARDLQTYRQLSQQFQQRLVRKIYEAVLSGSLTTNQGEIDLPLWGDPEKRPYQQVDEKRGKPSLTRFQVIAREENYTRVEFIPITGRTHQLRVHAADARGLGVPILGDRLYGCFTESMRLHLHARELYFQHPQCGQTLYLRAKTPF